MKKIKSISFFNTWLKLVALFLIPNLNAQSTSPNIINQKGTPVFTIGNNQNALLTNEDWHYGGVETEDGGYVFTTRIEQYDNSVNGKREYPGLIKYDKYFNVQWHQFLTPGSNVKITPFGNPPIVNSVVLEGAEVHTKVIETNDGFLAFGYYYQGSKIFVLKVDKLGNIAQNFPRVFDYSSADNYQINDIVHVNTNNFTGYLGVGRKNNYMALFQLDEQLENLTTTMLGNGNDIKGEIFGMCLLFPNGSKMRDTPKNNNELPWNCFYWLEREQRWLPQLCEEF